MAHVTLAFHPSVQTPEAARLAGSELALEPDWTVRELASAIERHFAALGLGVRVGALINPARQCAVPPHELAAACFNSGDSAVIVGDIRASLWPELAAPLAPNARVPITIFTGFLGAGKTTVLNHLLMGQRDKKFAVIENEFGEVPIDNELLQSLAEQVVVMENGCMCCTIRGDLLGAFDAIRKQMEQGTPLDAVLIETTGMADPVPIVRTLRQTPAIAEYFRLDGTITLVDSKTIRDRLGECAEGTDDQERHQQISFADRILLNKVDLVNDRELVEVWHRIRGFNPAAPVIASVRGVVPASELTGIGAFDADRIALEEEVHGSGHGNGHGDGHGRGHECDAECLEGHTNGHGDGAESCDECEEEHSHGHTHGHDSRHDSAISSFSIVRKGVEVEPLAFARWVRIIATLPEAQGKLYRSKGVLAAAGRSAKLIFHAVADITETSDGPEWQDHEQRVCKIVFIGKNLARKEIEERFLELLQPSRPDLRPRMVSGGVPCGATFATLAQAGLLHAALLGCWVQDLLKVSQASASMHDTLFGPQALTAFQTATSLLPVGAPRGMQTMEGHFWLQALLPLRSIRTYARAWREANVKLNTPTSVQHLFGEPLRFDTFGDVEAAAVMWQELSEKKTEGTANFVVEFVWRPETMKSFFDVAGSATSSGLVRFTVEDPNDSDLDDDLKFRVNLNPESSAETPGLNLHRLSLQLVGGKSSSHIYQIFFHTINPSYQIHVNVPDHRVPVFPTKEVFHQWHPLMASLKRRPRLRFLLRLKTIESGPLDAMCGCCG